MIIASIHNRYKLDEDQMTKRVINALKNPLFKVWGHPLGRLVERRRRFHAGWMKYWTSPHGQPPQLRSAEIHIGWTSSHAVHSIGLAG